MTDTADHSLNLDTRQREMLAAMGVRYWWPEAQASQTATTTPALPGAVERANASQSGAAATTPATSTVATPSRTVPAPSPTLAPETPKREANYSTPSIDKADLSSDFHPDDSQPAHPAEALLPHAPPHPPTLLDWPALTQAIQHCTACSLCQGRKQAVPGTGNPQARWMIVGEAPGEQEDKQGLPFVGPAGQLLDAMLAAMGLTREADVYIANVIKCRPPHNRNPEPIEVAQCRPYLQRQIELVQPDLILALGRFAAQALLADVVPNVDKLPLGKLRGQVYPVNGRPVVVSYHPAYLLRSPTEKGKVWTDLCLAMAHLGYNPLAQHGT